MVCQTCFERINYFFFFGFNCFGLAVFPNFLMLSATGKFSGIVPPSSCMVLRTFLPTSKCVWLALCLPFIFSRRNFSSVCVALKRLAASSVLPTWSGICWLLVSPFFCVCLWHPARHINPC